DALAAALEDPGPVEPTERRVHPRAGRRTEARAVRGEVEPLIEPERQDRRVDREVRTVVRDPAVAALDAREVREQRARLPRAPAPQVRVRPGADAQPLAVPPVHEVVAA